VAPQARRALHPGAAAAEPNRQDTLMRANEPWPCAWKMYICIGL
jgi:hypothetical protein